MFEAFDDGHRDWEWWRPLGRNATSDRVGADPGLLIGHKCFELLIIESCLRIEYGLLPLVRQPHEIRIAANDDTRRQLDVDAVEG
jgi:hypothetical protein